MPGNTRVQPELARVQSELIGIHRALTTVVAGARGKTLIDDLRAASGGSTSDVVWQALYADCLRIVHGAVMADGDIADDEITAIFDMVSSAARNYACTLRVQYGEFAAVDRESVRDFLDRYAADRGPFGRGARLRWPGLVLCRKAAELGANEALQRYGRTMTSLVAEACRVGGVSDADSSLRRRIDELDELRRMLAGDAESTATGIDRRVQAFMAPTRVFAAVQQAYSIFENDPFDVESVHCDARASFEQLVAYAAKRPMLANSAKMLLVLGDSGAGKTHLLRGFRRHVQEESRGFIVYAQLQSRSEDYSRYLLWNLVDSLSHRYSEQSSTTGLRELASGLLRLVGPSLRERVAQLADDSWEGEGSLGDHVNELVGELLEEGKLGSFDPDLLRVLLYALRPDQSTTSSVYKYLRCDSINAHDLSRIGNVVPRTHEDHPHRMILELARFAAVVQRAFVFMVDQADLAGFDEDATKIFKRAIDALYRVVSEVPSAVAVIACLSDLYDKARIELNRPALDRLERDPPIAKLQINRSYAEIEAVVSRRLSCLFAEHGTVSRPEDPVYPIPRRELQQHENRRLRDVLEWCHEFQTQCALAGKIITSGDDVGLVRGTPPKQDREADLDQIAATWHDQRHSQGLEVPDEDDGILDVVVAAAKAYADEVGLSIAMPRGGGVRRIELSAGADSVALAIAVTNGSYRGGAFTRQIEALRRARRAIPVAIRTLEFPRGPVCDKAVSKLMNKGGGGVYVDGSTMRVLVAFQQFQPPFPADRVSAWQRRDRPISSLPAVAEIFDFERLRATQVADESNTTLETQAIAPSSQEAPGQDVVPPPAKPASRGGRRASEPNVAAEPDHGDDGLLDTPVDVGARATRHVRGRGDMILVEDRSIEALAAPVAPRAGSVSKQQPGRASSTVTQLSRKTPPTGTLVPSVATVASTSITRGAGTPTAASSATDPDTQATIVRDVSRSTSDPPPYMQTRGAPQPQATAVSGAGATPLRAPPPSGAPAGDAKPRDAPKPPISERSVLRPRTQSPSQIWIGNSTSMEAEPRLLELGSLLRHIAIVDSPGIGSKMAFALNLIEQALERDVAVVVLDRTGDLCGYANPSWWQRTADTTRARGLAERIDVRLFTPGIRGGRPLSLAVIPDLTQVSAAEREPAVHDAAGALAAMMQLDGRADKAALLAVLTKAIAALAAHLAPCGLGELIALVESRDETLAGCDEQLRRRLIADLALLLGNADVFAPGAELLTVETLIGRSVGGKVPLAIASTRFLGDAARVQTWVTQLIACLNSHVATARNSTPRVVVLFDGAELLLPTGAAKSPSTEPLQDLLRGAQAAGVGVMLASQNPAGFDYRPCGLINTWFLGRTEERSVEKMKPLFEHRPLGHKNLSRLESGRFVMLRDEGPAAELDRGSSLLRPDPLAEAELMALAARTMPRSQDVAQSRKPGSDERLGAVPR